jgi:hypothetical protein
MPRATLRAESAGTACLLQCAFSLMSLLSKIAFPFCHGRGHMDRYAWHRFAVVLFWAALIAIMLAVWLGSNASEMRSYAACLRLNISMEKEMTAGCDAYLPHRWWNMTFAVLVSLVSSYLLQIVYYKVILYVASGRETSRRSGAPYQDGF